AMMTSWGFEWRSCMKCSCVDVRPERSSRFENHTDERLDTRVWRPMFVVGISCTRPKTRAFVTERTFRYERTWAYQTKSAFSDATYIALLRLICNGDGYDRCRLRCWRRGRSSPPTECLISP